MNYIYCGAYGPLLFALYLKSLGKEITIISYHKDIIKYCKAEKINYIQFNFIRPTVSSIYKIFALKKRLDNIIEKINVGKKNRFFLTGNAKIIDAFYLAKELSKKGFVVYYTDPHERKLKIYSPPRSKPIFFKGGIIRIALKLILNLDLIYYTGRGIPFFGIDDKFKEKYNIIEYTLNCSSEKLILETINRNATDTRDYDALIIDDGSVKDMITYDSVRKVYGDVLKLPLKFIFKKHPWPTAHDYQYDPSFYDLFINCEKIPRYMPVELCYKDIKQDVISILSASLVTASQLKHLKAIALLELVDWYNDSFKKEVKNNLIKKSKNKIFFPTNFDELRDILLDKSN